MEFRPARLPKLDVYSWGSPRLAVGLFPLQFKTVDLNYINFIALYEPTAERWADHRIGLTLHRLNEILEGDLAEVIGALKHHEQEMRLKSTQSANTRA